MSTVVFFAGVGPLSCIFPPESASMLSSFCLGFETFCSFVSAVDDPKNHRRMDNHISGSIFNKMLKITGFPPVDASV